MDWLKWLIGEDVDKDSSWVFCASGLVCTCIRQYKNLCINMAKLSIRGTDCANNAFTIKTRVVVGH
jgi:hypothetical protein